MEQRYGIWCLGRNTIEKQTSLGVTGFHFNKKMRKFARKDIWVTTDSLQQLGMYETSVHLCESKVESLRGYPSFEIPSGTDSID